MIAFVDESILLAGRGCYVLGCVVLPADDKAQVRRAARKAIPAGRTFHWTKERPEVRHAMLQVIADHATHLLAYGHRPVVRREHEGARAKLLNALLEDLSAANVRELVLESRQEHNDARDRQVIGSRTPRGDAALDYRHEGPRQEPLLWLADALAGAVMSQIRKDGRYVAALPDHRLIIRSLLRPRPQGPAHPSVNLGPLPAAIALGRSHHSATRGIRVWADAIR